MQSTTPETVKARVCVTKTGQPQFSFTPIGPDASQRKSELKFVRVHKDGDEYYWTTKPTDFKAVYPDNHPLAFKPSNNRLVDQGEKQFETYGPSGWGPNSDQGERVTVPDVIKGSWKVSCHGTLNFK